MARRTKILATIGPASRSEPVLRALIDAGVDAFRLNFSFGSHEEHARAVDLIRRASRDVGRPVAIVQDLQGAKVRVGRLKSGPLKLKSGQRVTLATEGVRGHADAIPVNYPALLRALKPGDRMLLGDGEVELRVESITTRKVKARVIEDGEVRENQGVHLPGVLLAEDAISGKDTADLRFGLKVGVDYVALSFVGSGDDVRRLKQLIKENGGNLPVVAKLETQAAIHALDDILAASDGVMVARGDLGLELPPEKVPLLQKEIIRRANQKGVLVITATQMLESMINSPRPTRAEASDVANALLDGTDAVMLSAETAVGRNPVEAVRMMARIAEEAEGPAVEGHVERSRLTYAHAMSRAARELARDVRAAAIVIFTRSGYSARLVSKERPGVPIFAFTPNETVSRELALWWGITPLLLPFAPSAEEMIARAERSLVERGLVQSGDIVVVARWSALRARGWSNFVKVHRVRT